MIIPEFEIVERREALRKEVKLLDVHDFARLSARAGTDGHEQIGQADILARLTERCQSCK